MKKRIAITTIESRPVESGLHDLMPVKHCELTPLNVFVVLSQQHKQMIRDVVVSNNIQTVVDIGCGSGWHALEMHRYFEQNGLSHVRVFAIDSDNKEHFSPDVKLPFVNHTDATTLHDLSSHTLFLSIWPCAHYFLDKPNVPTDAWGANLVQGQDQKVRTVCPVGKTSSFEDYPIRPHWIHDVIENNPDTLMLHIGDISDTTVATQGVFPGYIMTTYEAPDTTVYLLKHNDVSNPHKRPRLDASPL